MPRCAKGRPTVRDARQPGMRPAQGRPICQAPSASRRRWLPGRRAWRMGSGRMHGAPTPLGPRCWVGCSAWPGPYASGPPRVSPAPGPAVPSSGRDQVFCGRDQVSSEAGGQWPRVRAMSDTRHVTGPAGPVVLRCGATAARSSRTAGATASPSRRGTRLERDEQRRGSVAGGSSEHCLGWTA